MSEERTTIGLAPRKRPQGKASNLLKENRIEAQAETREVSDPKINTDSAPVAKAQLSMSVDAEVLGRARAAFRYVQFHERVPSFAEFVTAALETEIRRVEMEHNNGETLTAEKGNLPRGRRTQ